MSNPNEPRRRSRLPFVIVGVVVVLAAIAAIVWFLVLPEDDDPVADLKESVGSGESVATDDLDGTWRIVAGSGDETTFAGYLVEEVFAQGARHVTASGRSTAVTGEATVSGGTVTAVSITVDTTELESDQGRRDNAIRSRGLETDRFPEATFELTEPVELPTGMTDGNVSKATVTGDLTLHGVTRSVTVPLDVRPLGDAFTVLARIPVDFADYDIEAPSVGGFVEVEDNGQIELRINFARG